MCLKWSGFSLLTIGLVVVYAHQGAANLLAAPKPLNVHHPAHLLRPAHAKGHTVDIYHPDGLILSSSSTRRSSSNSPSPARNSPVTPRNPVTPLHRAIPIAQAEAKLETDWNRLSNGSISMNLYKEFIFRRWHQIEHAIRAICKANGLGNECQPYYVNIKKDLDQFITIMGKTLKFYDIKLLQTRLNKELAIQRRIAENRDRELHQNRSSSPNPNPNPNPSSNRPASSARPNGSSSSRSPPHLIATPPK